MVSRRQFLRGDFSARPDPSANKHIAVIGSQCMAFHNVVCRSCGDACPEQAIRFTPRVMAAAVPLVNGDRCTGCGDCVAACPAAAIAVA